MKVLAVFVATVIATAYAQEICCTPEVYEIRSEGYGKNVRDHFMEEYQELANAAYDHTNQVKAYEVERYITGSDQPRTERYRLVEDYKKDVYWRISEDKCSKYSLGNATLHRCVPPGAVFQETFYLGDRQLVVDTWLHQREEKNSRGVSYLSYVQGNCVPYGESFKGERINPDDKTTEGWDFQSGFVNYQKGIRDPERFFKLPSNCPK